MKLKLLRYNNDYIEIDMNEVISITAHGNLVYVKLTNRITHAGYCLSPL